MTAPRDWRLLLWHVRYDLGVRVTTSARKAWTTACNPQARVVIDRPTRIGPGFELEIGDSSAFIVGPGADFRRGFVCEIADGGRVVIGEGTIFTGHCMIQCSTSIEIGQRCAFGQSTLIYDGAHRYTTLDQHWLDQGYDFTPIRIGDGAGISDKSTVTADIGERAIIASHSVVNRPIPAYCVAAGVPARVVRKFGPHEQGPSSVPVSTG
jgi:acetyltransferase-like isoleucine patch superfamily enzyme